MSEALRHLAVLSFLLLVQPWIFPPAGLANEGTDRRSPRSAAPVTPCEVVRMLPHDRSAYTQGLLYHQGHLYEGTGGYGSSTLRQVDLKTGKILRIRHLPPAFFGEGIALRQDRLYQLTWQSRKGFVFDLRTFQEVGRFTYATEGWGLTEDGKRFILSDGTANLYFLDPSGFREIRRVIVRDGGRSVGRLNELEYVRGQVLANVWGTSFLVRIDPQTGVVMGWIDCSSLAGLMDPLLSVDVLNGIAYDARGDRLFVTGKHWPVLFEIRLNPSGRKTP